MRDQYESLLGNYSFLQVEFSQDIEKLKTEIKKVGITDTAIGPKLRVCMKLQKTIGGFKDAIQEKFNAYSEALTCPLNFQSALVIHEQEDEMKAKINTFQSQLSELETQCRDQIETAKIEVAATIEAKRSASLVTANASPLDTESKSPVGSSANRSAGSRRRTLPKNPVQKRQEQEELKIVISAVFNSTRGIDSLKGYDGLTVDKTAENKWSISNGTSKVKITRDTSGLYKMNGVALGQTEV